ncbi:hypothetical protein HELRODRAFT_190692 [Helobdella robusta]|uniref:Integrator complex subunit 10 n=1 Tax=Helobdella robusta TaxID=6412 RepID=T1FS75_HELRO|nr:hypothetical protein HELRODRAFT_190692 [Helobdella robusta]ESO09031.1 hypothetical protein HELRODRAFT_190692 [Helobdella robusta]
MQNDWIKCIRQEINDFNWLPSKNARICSDHFCNKDYKGYDGERKVMLKKAFPCFQLKVMKLFTSEELDWLKKESQSVSECSVAHGGVEPEYATKSWLVVASALFPNSFEIHLKKYQMEKKAKNVAGTARSFEEMFIHFPNKLKVFQEIKLMLDGIVAADCVADDFFPTATTTTSTAVTTANVDHYQSIVVGGNDVKIINSSKSPSNENECGSVIKDVNDDDDDDDTREVDLDRNFSTKNNDEDDRRNRKRDHNGFCKGNFGDSVAKRKFMKEVFDSLSVPLKHILLPHMFDALAKTSTTTSPTISSTTLTSSTTMLQQCKLLVYALDQMFTQSNLPDNKLLELNNNLHEQLTDCIEMLLAAEKREYNQQPINPYREYLVLKVLPVMLRTTTEAVETDESTMSYTGYYPPHSTPYQTFLWLHVVINYYALLLLGKKDSSTPNKCMCTYKDMTALCIKLARWAEWVDVELIFRRLSYKDCRIDVLNEKLQTFTPLEHFEQSKLMTACLICFIEYFYKYSSCVFSDVYAVADVDDSARFGNGGYCLVESLSNCYGDVISLIDDDDEVDVDGCDGDVNMKNKHASGNDDDDEEDDDDDDDDDDFSSKKPCLELYKSLDIEQLIDQKMNIKFTPYMTEHFKRVIGAKRADGSSDPDRSYIEQYLTENTLAEENVEKNVDENVGKVGKVEAERVAVQSKKRSIEKDGGGVVDNFKMAVSIWEVLNSSANAEVFEKLFSEWNIEKSWCTLKLFKERYVEALNLISLLLFETNSRSDVSPAYVNFTSSLKQCVSSLHRPPPPPSTSHQHLFQHKAATTTKAPTSTTQTKIPKFTHKSTKLEFMHLTDENVLYYCADKLLGIFINCWKTTDVVTDDVIGHMLVLLQHDWRKYEQLFMDIRKCIEKKGSFAYTLFSEYITHVDILEYFAYLASLESRVSLFLIPISTPQTCRAVTRGVNKSGKDDMKEMIMKRLTLTSADPRDHVMRFIIKEADRLKAAICSPL